MSRWFRFYDEAVNDPKVQRLAPDLFKAWVNLLCLASKGGGVLPATAEIAFVLRIKPTKAAEYMTALKIAELLDVRDDGAFVAHNWNARQFKSDVSNERVKRHRERKYNVTSTVTETTPETDNRTEQIAERKKDGADAPPELVLVSEEKQFFDRCKEILGPKGNGLGAKLLKSKGKVIGHAKSVLEMASTKADPAAYIGAVIRGADRSEMGEKQQPGYGDAWW